MDKAYQELIAAIIRQSCDDYIAGMQYLNNQRRCFMEIFIRHWNKIARARITQDEKRWKKNVNDLRKEIVREGLLIEKARNAVIENKRFILSERFVMFTNGTVDGGNALKALKERARSELPRKFIGGKPIGEIDYNKMRRAIREYMYGDYKEVE